MYSSYFRVYSRYPPVRGRLGTRADAGNCGYWRKRVREVRRRGRGRRGRGRRQRAQPAQSAQTRAQWAEGAA